MLFSFMDIDGSGELEPDEINQFRRQLMGQSKDAKAKQDAKDMVLKKIAGVRRWFTETTGFPI